MQPRDLCVHQETHWAKSPTAAISAPRSSLTTPRFTVTRGPTPKRSLSAVSTVKKLSTTVGTSVDTLWARALHVPRVSPVFCSLRSVKSHQETHSEPLAQDPALGPSPFCFKKEIHNDLSLLQHKGEESSAEHCDTVTSVPTCLLLPLLTPGSLWFRRPPLLLLLSRFSHVRLCATPQTAAHQTPLSLGFSRQEYWSGLPFPSPIHPCMLSRFSRVQLCATLWTAAHQAPLSIGFSRQELLEWVAMSSSRRSSQARDQTHIFYVFCIGKWVLY